MTADNRSSGRTLRLGSGALRAIQAVRLVGRAIGRAGGGCWGIGLLNGLAITRWTLPAVYFLAAAMLGPAPPPRGPPPQRTALLAGYNQIRFRVITTRFMVIGQGRFLGFPIPAWESAAIALSAWVNLLETLRRPDGMSCDRMGGPEKTLEGCGLMGAASRFGYMLFKNCRSFFTS